MNREAILQQITSHKPPRKGASEAEIAAEIAKRHTTAELAAGVKRAEVGKGMRA